jgi:cytochrome P450
MGVMKMRKLDSFLKESMRMHPIGQSNPVVNFLTSVGSARQAMKPYTFSNGTTIPKGVLMASPMTAILKDESIYENPHVFDGFRFSNLRERQGESAKHHSSNTDIDFLPFGHGHHAWYPSC